MGSGRGGASQASAKKKKLERKGKRFPRRIGATFENEPLFPGGCGVFALLSVLRVFFIASRRVGTVIDSLSCQASD